MTTLLWLSLVLPLVAAVAVRLLTLAVTPAVTVLGAVAAAAAPVALLLDAAGGDRARSGFTWLPGAPGLDVGLRLDGLSAAMAVLVAAVGCVVLVYAVGYFEGDPRRRSALAGLLGFLGAMQGVVLADGYLPLLVCWELVGAASARLIAYSRDDPAAAPGAVRAFLTTRAADAGFYVAVLALYSATGTLAFATDRPGGALGALVGLGLVLAAMGKSAQVPLQTWLSGAMAGPTPVSALLHSATMVAAGVYLLMRSAELLAGWPLQIAGWVGAVTAVAAAGIALAQNDLKRVLAGSTASQLGLMFVGVAAGGPAVGLFLLVTHAAGKAGLFLATGVFQHARATTDLEGLRGAGHDDWTTFSAFAVCALSIAAVPPFAAFWSKDHIAAASERHAVWSALVLLAAAGSAAYLLRPAIVLWSRTGATGRASGAGRGSMLAALSVLALASTVLGVADHGISDLLDAGPLPTSRASLALSLVALLAGAAAVLARPALPSAMVELLRAQLGVDAVLAAVIQRPARRAAASLNRVAAVLDRAVDGVASATLAVARSQDWVERRGIDAAVDGLAHAVGRSGERTRRLQSGRLYEYLRDAALGAGAVAVVVLITALA